MSDLVGREVDVRLNAITGPHPSAADMEWLTQAAVDFAARDEQVWLQLPVETRQTFVRWLTDPDVPHPEGDVFPFLLRAAHDPDAEVRGWAIEALADSPTARALPVLLNLLVQFPDPEVRASVAVGIDGLVHRAATGQLDADAAKALRTTLLTAYQTEPLMVRTRALETLAHFSADPEVEAAIADAYQTGDPDLTVAALFAMGRNRAPRWFPILYAELDNPDPEARRQAVQAIGEYADPRAVDRLLVLVEDPDRLVQAAAVTALADIGGEVAISALSTIAASDDFFLSQGAQVGLERLRARS